MFPLCKLGVEDHQFGNVRITLQQIHTPKADSLSTVSLERQFHPQLVASLLSTANTVFPWQVGVAEALNTGSFPQVPRSRHSHHHIFRVAEVSPYLQIFLPPGTRGSHGLEHLGGHCPFHRAR